VLVFTQGPPRGWIDPWVIGAGVATVVFLAAFLIVERTAEHPIIPFSVFDNRSRVMTFLSLFMAGGYRMRCLRVDEAELSPWALREGIMLERLSSLREDEPLMLQALNFIDSGPHATVRALPAQSTRRNHIS
jgi:hypothetical protein